MRSVCVFCGSAAGARPEYARAAQELGRTLAARGLKLVYGGANIGLMGMVADAALEAGGQVLGIIPRVVMEKEVANRGLTELRQVETMHQRKATMLEASDGFVALPGGTGTLEEIFEVLAWGQLKLHAKPCGFLNVAGYYDPLLEFLDRAMDQGFLKEKHRSRMLHAPDTGALLDAMGFTAPPSGSGSGGRKGS